MADAKMMVGFGEVLIESESSGERVSGLGAEVAMCASRLGHAGVVISRIGQDAPGERTRQELLEAGVEVEHVQTDSDLPTGRRTIQTLGGARRVTLESRSAFDNVQWDFDLEDVAHQADAVVFGYLARRSSQTQTTMDRFLASCRHAIRVLDMTNLPASMPGRAELGKGLRYAEGAIATREVLNGLHPAAADRSDEDFCGALLAQFELAFIVLIDDAGRLRVWAPDHLSASSDETINTEDAPAATVGVLHGLLSGWEWSRALRAGVRFARSARDNQAEGRVPDDLLDAS